MLRKVWANRIKVWLYVVGRCSIVDKASANGSKGPGLTARWRQQFINACSIHLIKIKLQLEQTFFLKQKDVTHLWTSFPVQDQCMPKSFALRNLWIRKISSDFYLSAMLKNT